MLACCELWPALLSLLVSLLLVLLLLLNVGEEQQLQPAAALLLLVLVLPQLGGRKRSSTALHMGARSAWCCNSLAPARDLVTTAAGIVCCWVCGLCGVGLEIAVSGE